MGMIVDVRKALKDLGYIVKDTRQEKLATNEIVVVLDDLDVEIISTSEYHFLIWIALEWDSMKPDDIPEQVAKLCHDLETAIVTGDTLEKATFKFRKVEIYHPGLMYRVVIEIEYKKVINIW